MTRRTGCVLVTNNGLAGKCDHCRKTIAYEVGSHMHSDTFKRLLREFVKKHNEECGGKESPDEAAIR